MNNRQKKDVILQRVADILKTNKQLETYNLKGGNGSFGDVLFVKDINTEQQYAVKSQVVYCQFLKQIDQDSVTRCQNEFKTLKKCEHKNVVQVYSEFVIDNFHFIQMELCGQNLEQFSVKNRNNPLPLQLFLHFTNQILDAVEHIHSLKIKLRDLTLRNILLCEDGTLKLCDFGLAKPHDISFTYSALHSIQPRGAALYYPPELIKQIIESNEITDPKKVYEQTFEGDIWALGLCLSVLGGNDLGKISMFHLGPNHIADSPLLDQRCNNLIKYILKQDPEKRPSVQQIRKYIFENIINIVIPMNIVQNPVQGQMVNLKDSNHNKKNQEEQIQEEPPMIEHIKNQYENNNQLLQLNQDEENKVNQEMKKVLQEKFVEDWIENQKQQQSQRYKDSQKLMKVLTKIEIERLYEFLLMKQFNSIKFLKKGIYIIIFTAYSNTLKGDVTLKFANSEDYSYEDENNLQEKLKGVQQIAQQYEFFKFQELGVSISVNECCMINLKDEIQEKQILMEQDKIRIIKEICFALTQLHMKNIIHMNITITHFVKSKSSIYKLSGFTHSLFINNPDESFKVKIKAIPSIFSPEIIKSIQTKSSIDIKQSTDVYNLGIVILSVLGYQLDSANLQKIYSNNFNDLELFAQKSNQLGLVQIIIDRLLSKDPKDRIRSDQVFSTLYPNLNQN